MNPTSRRIRITRSGLFYQKLSLRVRETIYEANSEINYHKLNQTSEGRSGSNARSNRLS